MVVLRQSRTGTWLVLALACLGAAACGTALSGAAPEATGTNTALHPMGHGFMPGYAWAQTVNQAPTVDAGDDLFYAEFSTFELTGANVTDADAGDTLTYAWSTADSGITITDGGTLTPTITLTGNVASDTEVTLTLTANDGTASVSDSLTLTVVPTDGALIVVYNVTDAASNVYFAPGGLVGEFTALMGNGFRASGDSEFDPDINGNRTVVRYNGYEDAGNYTIQFNGEFTSLSFIWPPGVPNYILSVEQWGDTQWTSMEEMFRNTNVEFNASDLPDTSMTTSMLLMFDSALEFNGDMSEWDVSSVTNMNEMFELAWAFNSDISSWNVSSARDMGRMFSHATSFNQDISNWDVSSVTTMHRMFFAATSFNQDISNWDVSSVTVMDDMFHQATSFNQNLGKWYIVLDSNTVSPPGIVGTISAQNAVLDGQNPAYGIASVGDHTYFDIVNGNQLNMTSYDPDKTEYSVTITATGDFGTSNSRTYTIVTDNLPPTADAGDDQTVNEGDTVTLDGSGSSDPDSGDTLTYSWTSDESTPRTLTGQSPTFTAPSVASDTDITFTLAVSDGTLTDTDTVVITVQDVPPPPTTYTGPVFESRPNLAVVYNPDFSTYAIPKATDHNGDRVSVSCSPPPSPPLRVGTHQVTCTATDGEGLTSSITFRVDVDGQLPPPPRNLRATATQTSVTLTWDAPSTTVPIDGYVIYRIESGSLVYYGATNTASATTYTTSGPSNDPFKSGQTHTFAVRTAGNNGVGDSYVTVSVRIR